MAVKRYVGDKLVGPEDERNDVVNTISEGATFYSTTTPYRVYIRKNNVWEQISAATASGTRALGLWSCPVGRLVTVGPPAMTSRSRRSSVLLAPRRDW